MTSMIGFYRALMMEMCSGSHLEVLEDRSAPGTCHRM